MKLTLHYSSERSSDFVCTILALFSAMMIAFAFVANTPAEIASGLLNILRNPAGLITDYIEIGTIGGAFFNAGLLMLFSVVILRKAHLPFTGTSIASSFLMSGFALFGKNLLNVLPIMAGVYIYAKFRHESFRKFIYVAIFGTSLSPIVTEVGLLLGSSSSTIAVISAVLIGILIGFVLPPIAAYTLRVHQGYNLYNVGFAAGLIGLVIVSIMRSFGYVFEPRMQWSAGNNFILGAFLLAAFLMLIIAGFIANGKSFKGIVHIMRHSGRAIADFVVMDGAPVSIMNMGIVGLFATFYVIAVGGALNGPTIGGIFTIAGFGAYGKHLKNIIWVMLGVIISSLCMVWSLSDPSVLLAALFSTCLAPIAGHFGAIWGVVAGIIHSSVVLNVGVLYGGLNLYNNGFAAGLVCIVLLPLMNAIRENKRGTFDAKHENKNK